jgi:hypothetical protein
MALQPFVDGLAAVVTTGGHDHGLTPACQCGCELEGR